VFAYWIFFESWISSDHFEATLIPPFCMKIMQPELLMPRLCSALLHM
jgi:hypothetical protein